VLDVAHDTIELELRHLRSLESGIVEWVANDVLLDSLLELLDELVVDALLDINTGAGTAGLAVVEEDTHVGPLDGLVDIGVVEDDVGGLPTKLESNFLQVAVGSGLHDNPSDKRGTSKGNLVDVHVVGNGGTSSLSETTTCINENSTQCHEVSYPERMLITPGGKPASLISSAATRALRGVCSAVLMTTVLPVAMAGPTFHAHMSMGKFHLSSSQFLLNNPHECDFLRNDLSTDTDGLVPGVVESSGLGVNDLSVDLVRPTTVVSQASGSSVDVDLRVGNALSVVQRLDRGDLKDVLLNQIGELHKESTALCRGHLGPWAGGEGHPGGLHRDVDILLSGLVNRADWLLGGRVEDLESLALDSPDELAVDEPEDGSLLVRVRQGEHNVHSTVWGRTTHNPKGWSYFTPLGSSICCVRLIL
jgi:hypothetical protein